MIAEHGPFRVIIIDSVIALFRVEFSGRGELAERQQKLGQYLAELTRIAEEFNVAVFLVGGSILRTRVGGQEIMGCHLVDAMERDEMINSLADEPSHICATAQLPHCLLQVNQVTADPGAMSMFGPVMKPVGGNVSHLITSSEIVIFMDGCRTIPSQSIFRD